MLALCGCARLPGNNPLEEGNLIMPELFNRAALLEAERLTRLSLPAGALDHRAWCDTRMCSVIPFDAGTMGEAAAIHQASFSATVSGETITATVSEVITATATPLELEPTVSFTTETGGEPPVSVIAPLLERCVSALSETIPAGARGTLDPLAYISPLPFSLDDEALFLDND